MNSEVSFHLHFPLLTIHLLWIPRFARNDRVCQND